MRVIDAYLSEFTQESAATRRIIEAIPAEHLDWKPHEKGMSMRDLANHVLTLPAGMADVLGADSFDFADRTGIPEGPATLDELDAIAEESFNKAHAFLDGLDDARATAEWTLIRNGDVLMSMPRVVAIRSFLLNHLYHHRGQLSTYLRAVGAAVPSVYGPTADVDPFAESAS